MIRSRRRTLRLSSTASLFIHAIILVCCCIIVIKPVDAYQSNSNMQLPVTTARSKNRYFTGHVLLPPLQRIDPAVQQQLDPASDFLFVTYTNDPAQVAAWLAEHVPRTGCSILGFDLEVGSYCSR